jgi:hypothetical protein
VTVRAALWTHRSLKRCHRTPTGASTLTSKKKGRRSRASTTFSSQMSVVTQLSRQRSVTNSNSESTSGKVHCRSAELDAVAEALECEVASSAADGAGVRASCRRTKPCCWTRYDAMEDLPAQMPGHCQSAVVDCACLLASTQPYEHGCSWQASNARRVCARTSDESAATVRSVCTNTAQPHRCGVDHKAFSANLSALPPRPSISLRSRPRYLWIHWIV